MSEDPGFSHCLISWIFLIQLSHGLDAVSDAEVIKPSSDINIRKFTFIVTLPEKIGQEITSFKIFREITKTHKHTCKSNYIAWRFFFIMHQKHEEFMFIGTFFLLCICLMS